MITGEQAEAVGGVRVCRDCEYGRHNDRRHGGTFSLYVPSPPPPPSYEKWTCDDPSWHEQSGDAYKPNNIVWCPITGDWQWPKCAERNKNGDCALFKKYVEPEPEPEKPKRRWWRRG